MKQDFIQNAVNDLCNNAMYSIPNHKSLFLASTLNIHYAFFLMIISTGNIIFFMTIRIIYKLRDIIHF